MTNAHAQSASRLTSDSQGQRVSELQKVAARFEDRLRAAQQANPPTREMVKQAIKRQWNGRCPSWAKRLSVDVILRYGDDLAELFCQYPDNVVRLAPYELSIGHQSDRKDRINPIEVLTQDAQWTDEWGTRWAHSTRGTGPIRCATESRIGHTRRLHSP